MTEKLPSNPQIVSEHKVQAVLVTYDDGTRRLLVDDEPLLGAVDAADALGVRVQNIRAVKGLPDAVGYLRATPIWLGSEIKALAEQRQADQFARLTEMRDKNLLTAEEHERATARLLADPSS